MEARLVDAASQGDLNSVRAILTSTDANVDGLDVSRHVGFFLLMYEYLHCWYFDMISEIRVVSSLKECHDIDHGSFPFCVRS